MNAFIRRKPGRYVIALMAVLFTHAAFAQEPSELDKCSQTLAKVESSLGALDRKIIDALLSSVNRTCLSSVEYSEWSNELVYAAATAEPLLFLSSLDKQPQDVQKNILGELESPVNDGIDLKKAYQAISSAPDSRTKTRVQTAIKAAANNTGLSI